MPNRVRVNVRSLANTKAARQEKRNGRDVIIVPSATLPDDVVMNNVLYPADEIASSYETLNRTPAPAGHPTINNQFVSASDPEGINVGWIGAWNENARQVTGDDGKNRVFLDKVIDVKRANESEEGRAVLNAIEKGEPVHTSTGLWCNLEAANDNDGFQYIARNIQFDHDAILLNEEGAATPEQGVGMMVNGQLVETAALNGEQLAVINSVLDDAERELEWAADWAVRAVERMERASVVESIVSAIKDAIGISKREPSANKGEAEMSGEKDKELSAKVNAIEEGMAAMPKTIAEAVTNAVNAAVQPIKEHVEELQANAKADEEAKRATVVNKLVESGQWTEDDLTDIPTPALNKLVAKLKPGKAAAVNGAAATDDDDEFDGVDLNANMKEGK